MINGVFETVLIDIIKSQKKYPGEIFYLQPYSSKVIRLLKDTNFEDIESIPLYISVTTQLNQISYVADIINWDDKRHLSNERISVLDKKIKKYQPNETGLELGSDDKPVVNLISIKNLRKFKNHISKDHLIKIRDGKPVKGRTQAGGWTVVKELPLLSYDNSIILEEYHNDLDKEVSRSLESDDAKRKQRLNNADKFPEKVQTISSGFKRNPDVIAEVLIRANGICELCKSHAPFLKASDDSPYLEVHHWISLSEGGTDTVDNAVALCPNCHKQAHFGKEREYIRINKSLPSDY